MIYEYSYQLSDGTFTSIKPQDPNIYYTVWVSMSARQGYILRHKFTNEVISSLFCLLGASAFWEEIPMDKV